MGGLTSTSVIGLLWIHPCLETTITKVTNRRLISLFQKMEVAMRSTGALSISGTPTGVFSFSATTRFPAKLDANFLPKFGYKLPVICHNRGPKSGGLLRSMCLVALEEANLEETSFRLEIPQFKVIQVPPVPRSEFYTGSVLASEDVASGIRCIVIETEISRELVHRGDAYIMPGQLAKMRMKGGEVLRVPVSSAPFSKETNSSVLYKMRGDRPAGHVKAPNSTLSIKAPLHLHVTQSDFPLLYELKKGDEVEVGPFEPTGLDLRPVLFISGFPTMLFFASGRGIAVARAIIEAKEGDKGSLSLGFREEVRLYYSAPDPTLIAYKGKFKEWEKKQVKIRTTVSSTAGEDWEGFVGSFTSLWDEDDIEYDPDTTAAVVCVEDDARTEMKELLSHAGIPEKQVIYWDAP